MAIPRSLCYHSRELQQDVVIEILSQLQPEFFSGRRGRALARKTGHDLLERILKDEGSEYNPVGPAGRLVSQCL
ncbi:MAG: hypothetical protein ABGW82_13170, partial [Paracoccus sp. (in: a-proteobacteria)]